ncbi:S-adenosyl-L-methionine-dependent methyltransferase [Lizonia empirigonia]|nr:S-adenosyl-L-methionine-dependent methyltransferase [Lizonia empirigonia]
MSSEPAKKDWSATQYLKFNNERTRPVYDLVSQIASHITTPNPRIYDLGCGPGNSTKVLLDAFPGATITGMDSSPDMLAKASASLPGAEFVKGDLSTFALKEGEQVDLLFSNAVFHWLRNPTRIPTLTRLFETLRPGGVLAIQMPDNYNEQSHSLMREVAKTAGSAWSPYFADAKIGDLEHGDRPDLDPVEPPRAFYNALILHAASVNLWRTTYQHVLKDAGAIVEWVKGTGLQPYLQRIEDEEAKNAYLAEYERRLTDAYEGMVDGRVLLGYPRLFVLAVRK